MADLAQYIPVAGVAVFVAIFWSRIAAAFTASPNRPVSQPVAAQAPVVFTQEIVQQAKPKDTICDINRHVEALIEDARTRGDQELIDHLLAYLRGRVSVAKDAKPGV